MLYDVKSFIYFFIIASAMFCGIIRYKLLDRGLKTIVILLFITLITEITASVTAYKFHTNALVYSVFNFIQFFFIALYFNSSVDLFKKSNAAIYIGIVVIIGGILNYVYLPKSEMNTNFLLVEAFFTIAFALFSLYRQLLFYEQLDLFYYPHFWLSIIFLFFWSVTFMIWGLNNIMLVKFAKFWDHIWIFLWSINVVTYLGIAFVFVFYNKMHTFQDE